MGRKEGMEYNLVTKAGYEFIHMEVTGFQRKPTVKNLLRNIRAVKNLAFAIPTANRILNKTKPDLVIGCGGYVAGPIVRQAAKKGIKTAVHEQNAYPGVTNKILSKTVDKVFIATEKAAKYMAFPDKCIVCGNPVRKEITEANPAESRKKLGIPDDKTVVLSFGGSLGAQAVNNRMKALVKHNKDRKDIIHYHVVGKYDDKDFENFLSANGIPQGENLKVFEYLYNIRDYMARADLLITRCGALTIAETACMGKASILIPSPNVSENHQFYNGKVLTDIGAAVMIEEKDLNEKSIVETFDSLCADKGKLKEMAQKAKRAYNGDCLDIIYKNLDLS